MNAHYFRNAITLTPLLPICVSVIGLIVSHRLGAIFYLLVMVLCLIAAANARLDRCITRHPRISFWCAQAAWLFATFRIGYFWGKVCA